MSSLILCAKIPLISKIIILLPYLLVYIKQKFCARTDNLSNLSSHPSLQNPRERQQCHVVSEWLRTLPPTSLSSCHFAFLSSTAEPNTLKKKKKNAVSIVTNAPQSVQGNHLSMDEEQISTSPIL